MPPPQQLLSSSLSFKCLNFYLKVYLILLFILISALLPLSAPSDCVEARQWPNFCFALKNSTLLSDSAQKELTIREGRAQEMFCDMARLLTKIDCNQPYSVNQEQSLQCQEAYRDWACSVIVESFMEESEFGKSVHGPNSLMPFPSCDSVCHRVLRVCPYLTPDRNQLGITGHPALHPSQYGGHPAFYCPIRSGLFFAAFKASRSGGGGLGTEQHPVHHRYFYRSGTKVNLNDDLITSNDTSCCWTYSAALKTEQYGLYNSDDPSQTDLEDIIKSFSYNDGDHEDGGFGDLHKIPYRELLGTANQVQIQCLHVERPKQSQPLSSSSAHHSQISEADEEFQEEEEEEHSARQSHPQVLARTDFTSSAHLLHSPKSGNGGSGHGKGKDPSSPHPQSQPSGSGQALSRPMSRSVNTQDTDDMVAKLHRNEQTPLIPSQDSSESNYNYLHDDWFDVVSPRSKSIQKRNNYNFLNLASSSSSHPASNKEQKQSHQQHEEERQQEPSSVLNSEVSGEEDDTVSLYDGQEGVEGLEEDMEDPDSDLLDGDEGLDHQSSSDLDGGEEGTMSTRSSEDSPHRRRQEGAMMDQDFISTVSVRIERSISSLSSAPGHGHPLSSAKSSGSRPELFIEKLLPFRVRSVRLNLSRFRFTNILPLPSFLTNVLNVVNGNANKNTYNTIHHHQNNHHNRCFPLLLFNILLLLIIILLLIILVLLTTNFLPILLQILYTTALYLSSYSPHSSSSSKSAVLQFPRRTSRTRTRTMRLPPPEQGSWTRRERHSKYINYEEMDVREGEGNDEEYDDELTRGGTGGGEVTQFPQPQPNNDPPPLVSSSSVSSVPLSEHQYYYESETKHPPYYTTGRPERSMSRTFSKSNNNNTNKIIMKRINTDSTGRQTLDKHTKYTYYTNKIIITTNTSIILSGQIILISKQINTTTTPKQTLTVNNLRSESSQYYYYGQACHYCYSSYHSQLVASRLMMISSQLQLLGHLHLFSSHLQFLLLLLAKSTHLIDVVPLSATLLLQVNVNETKIEKVYGVVEVDWGGFVDRDYYSKCGGNNYCVQLSGRVVQKMSLVWTFLSVLEMQRRRHLTSAPILNSCYYISCSPSLKLTMKLKWDTTTVLVGIVENLRCVTTTTTTTGSSWLEGKEEEEGNWSPLQLTKFKRFVENNSKMKGCRELLRVSSVFLVAIMNRELKLNVVVVVVRRFIKCRHPVYGSNYFSSSNGIILIIFFVNVIRIRRKSHPIIIISRLRFFHHLHYHYHHHHPLRHHHFVWVVHRLSDVDEWTPDPLIDLPMLRHRHPLLFLKCTTRIRMNIIIVIMTDNDDKDNIASTFVTSILWLRYRYDNRSSGCRRTNIIIRKLIRTCSSRSHRRRRRHQRCPHNSINNNNSKTVSKMIKIKLENSSTMIVCNINNNNNKLKNKIILINILYNKNLEEVTCRNNKNVYYDSRPLLLSVVLLLKRLTLSTLVRFMMIVTKSKLLVLKLRWEKGKLLLLLRKLKSKFMRISNLLLLLYSTIHVFIPWENVLVIQILVLLLLLLLLLLVVPQSLRHLQRLNYRERSENKVLLQQEQEGEQDKLVIISQSNSYEESYSYSDPNNNSNYNNSNSRIKASHCYYYYYYYFDDEGTSCWRSMRIFMGIGVNNQNQGINLTDPHQLRDQQKQHGQSISILPKTVSANSDSSYKLLKCSQERKKLLLQVFEEQSEILVVIVLSLPTNSVVLLLLLHPPPRQHSMSNNQRSFSASNTITEVNYDYYDYYYYYRYNIITSHKHIDTL